ncbi:MAG TPA: hydroxymethylglutaryl-CoA lyase [Casimicrobiaceae bacterium]|nr:hydroxymethylglutaryl-CoA lyase [Casimicrobiaceae bacterium]
MSNLPSSVRIMEVGPRDGLQIEKTIFSTEQKVELVNRLVDAGLRQIEVGSFVNPKGVPQMADSDEVFRRLPQRDGVEYHGLWLNARGLDRAVENGHVKVTGKLILTATDTFSKRNTNKDIDETLAAIPEWIAQYRRVGIEVDDLHIPAAFGCNYEGEVPVSKVVELLARGEEVMKANGCKLKRTSLADTMGWGNPEQTRRLIGAVRERWPDLQIRLHLHDTRGTALANASAAMDLGVDEFDSSIGGLGGCPFAGNKSAAGNVCTEDLVFLCEEMGVDTGVDLEALIEVARFAEEMVGHELPGKLMKARSLSRYRTH